MGKGHPRAIRPSGLFVFCAALIGLCYAFASGCAYRQTVDKTGAKISKTAQKMTRKIRFSDDDLQRITALVSFENRALYQAEDFSQLFRAGIPDYLNKQCNDVMVLDPGAGEDFERLKKPPRLTSGGIDNFALANIGRALGLNAVIIGSLDDIGLVTETEGLVFKDILHFIQVLVHVEVYDTETGTKILDDSFKRKVKVDKLDYDLMRSEGKLRLPDLSATLKDLLGEMGERICWTIEDQPWNGFITAFAGDRVTLSAGKLSGLEPGDELDVFDNSRTIQGRDGQRFFVRGPKMGRIRIVSVEPRRSEAVVVSNNGIKIGNSVRVK